MKRIAVLGAGLVGRVIARDLAKDPSLEVHSVDRSEGALADLRRVAPNVRTSAADLTRPDEVARAVAPADVVVLAMPGFLGHRTLGRVVECGKPVVDISFSPEDPYEWDDLARRNGVPALVDFGVAPGLSNLLVGRSVPEFDAVTGIAIFVGGLPSRRVWPWEYRAVFSPTDVLEEYTRPCRIRRGGQEVVVPALSEVELVEFTSVGTLEAFLTDGLRTLLRTQSAPNLVEKTLRYPGHADKMRVLRESGFFGTEPIDVGETRVVPRQLTERLLFPAWELPAGESEFTVLRVEVTGTRGGASKSTVWELFDSTDHAAGATSMARTTGFPCAIAARMLADGAWLRPGIHPPEILGADPAITARILSQLEARGVNVRQLA